MSEWQPIETAPKDGSIFILYRNRKGYKEVSPCRWSAREPMYPWQVLCEEYGENFYPDDDYLRGWRPLPEPPK